MSVLQTVFVAFTFLVPPLLWFISRRVQSPRLVRAISWSFAGLLVASYAAALVIKVRGDGRFLFDEAIPMHLCDWASIATILALTRGSKMAFELAYCWGLAGTIQALFTPAIEIEVSLRVILFLSIHSLIPAGVFWLLFECGMRPRPGAFWRVLLWSEIYLALAIFANRMTGGNYGFLAGRPPNPSLLDYFSDVWWIYVLQINATAVFAFALLLLPWTLRRNRRVRQLDTTGLNGTSDA